MLRERLRRKLAARAAAELTIERIAAGAPRSSFGSFRVSFEDVVPEISNWTLKACQARLPE